MPNPGDEHAAGEVPEALTTADRLRMAAGFLESGVRLDPRDMVALADEVDVLEARIEALERVRHAAEEINIATHQANRGPYLGKCCPHGNLPVYPTHGRWCDECWQELEDALAALRSEEER